jgi:hypothetical protein
VFGTASGFRQEVFKWHRLFKLAGLNLGRDKGVLWHSLRHEFCSRTAENTGDPVVAQELARHNDLRTTQGYLHARRARVLAGALYVQLLVDVFRAASSTSDAQVTPEQSRRATTSYRVLPSLRAIPGVGPDQSVGEATLRTWVTSVRNLAAEADRTDIANNQIGKLLAYAPSNRFLDAAGPTLPRYPP